MGGKRRKGITPEAREAQLINDAMSVAEDRIKNGNASDSLLIQVMRLGSSRAELEKEKLRSENALLEAKRESIRAAKNAAETYDRAIRALKGYDSEIPDDDYEDEDD